MPDGTTTATRTLLERPSPPGQTALAPSAQQSRPPVQEGRPPSRSRRLLRYALMLGAALLILVIGAWYWLTGGRYVSTDDAYVQANVQVLATDVSGVVAAIPVHDGEQVKAGQILFRLDPLKFQLAVDQARAGLEQTKLDLDSLKADYVRAVTAQAAQAAQVQGDRATFDRYAALVKTHAATQQQYDDARFKLLSDEAQLGSAQAQVRAALAKLGGNADLPDTAMPAYKAAQAKLAEAEREMSHAVVRAPYDGIVTQVPKLQIGQYLPAGTAAFGLVGANDFWVAAQPKETQLTHARAGDPVTVTVDAFPGVTWHGELASIAPATDQQFAILPAQNSSGNWVKVVQRVPVRITLKPIEGGPPLSSGMSADVSIDTGHKRSLGDLF
jgi:membrane fusion protein, multidrug efflux system